jgi:hypothetical protein
MSHGDPDKFGILPKHKAISYTKPYPKEFDRIPLSPKFKVPNSRGVSLQRGLLHPTCNTYMKLELNGKCYYKWHSSVMHDTRDYKVLR